MSRHDRFDHDLRFEIGFATETGKRADNQDYAAARIGRLRFDQRRATVAALADGVGGAKGGREAAELTVRGFFDGFFNLPASLGVRQAAARALESINGWIVAQGRADPKLARMATTFTALILDGRRGHCVHVGDSRLYRLGESGLERLTDDHVLGHGDFDNILHRAVGIDYGLLIDHQSFSLRPHERYLLCSDGVHGSLRAAEIKRVMSERAAPDRTAEDLVAAALGQGSADNCTAMVIDILDTPPASAEDVAETFENLIIAEPPSIGQIIDDFRVDSLLSEGRTSRLMRARDLRGGSAVVLKFPKMNVAEDALFRRAFINEAFVASRVRSPWIGETIELPPERQTRLYSVMPYYDGETLENRLKRDPPLALAEGALLAARMARAIVTLHRAGIIHRDIKPDNIMLLGDGGVKLLDLGVARLPQLEDFSPVHAPGTPSYMAPELFGGAPGDEASDLFALGVTVYRLFTRAYPYGEIEPFSKPRFGKPASFVARRPDLPAWLEGAIARAVAVDPAQRYGDVLEFAFEIENGARRGGPAEPPKKSLYEKNPLMFWQGLCALLGVLLVLSLALHH